MSVELFITNLDFLTKLQSVFNLDYFILNFNSTQINVQGKFFLKINKRADQNKAVQGGFFFLKINKHAGQIPIQMQENKRAEGFFSQKR